MLSWANFNTYNEGKERAFEALCDHLFENWINRIYNKELIYYTVVNGSGGDGGVEAYAKLNKDRAIGLQAKWFIEPLDDNRISKIKQSIQTAKKIRSNLVKYIICIPRNLASKKIVKGNKITTNSEEDKWHKLLIEINQIFPSLEVELWDEYRIMKELEYPEAEGIVRFWFAKEEISPKLFQIQFDKAKNSWLRYKYISNLHCDGTIAKEADKLLAKSSFRAFSLKEVHEIRQKIEAALGEIDFCSPIIINVEDLKKLEEIQRVLLLHDRNALSLIQALRSGSLIVNYGKLDYINFSEDINKIVNGLPPTPFSIIKNDLKKAFEDLDNIDFKSKLDTIYCEISKRYTIFLGNPGTGKTHGAANLVENMIKSDFPAILIQAKSIENISSWKDILTNSLGLSSGWSEESIWQAFESISHRCDVRRISSEKNADGFPQEPTRFLICVDGLDETRSWDGWIHRLEEIGIITENYPRLRFIICSRPYVFNNNDVSEELLGSVMNLPDEGDVAVSELFDLYTKFYRIDVNNVPWIKWCLTSPLALRLFCDQFEERKIDSMDSTDMAISRLLKHRIEKIEKEMNQSLGEPWSYNDSVILKILNALSEHFLNTSTIKRDDICDIIINIKHLHIKGDLASKVIDKLADYGILGYNSIHQTDPLKPPEIFYSITYQSIMDYLIAIKSVKEPVEKSEKRMPIGLVVNYGAQQMAAIMLLTDHKLLIGDLDYWVGDLSEEELENLRLWALSHVASDDLKKYISWVESVFCKSMPSCRKVLNGLIIKVARIPDHPLGGDFVHNILTKFDKPAKRDLLWSGPEYIPEKNNSIWEGWGQNDINKYELYKEDTHKGMPILFAWSLTTIDNNLRYHCRRELTKWGRTNLNEFLKLIEITFKTNDPQMKEDLICIAYGIANLAKSNESDFKNLAEWIVEEIFYIDKIKTMKNVIVRYAARGIVERAYIHGLVEKSAVEKSRPPYGCDENLIELDAEAASSIADNFGPIDFDLAWYVIKQSYEGFFEILPSSKYQVEESDDFDALSTNIVQKAINGDCGKLDITTKTTLKTILKNRKRKTEAIYPDVFPFDFAEKDIIKVYKLKFDPENYTEPSECGQVSRVPKHNPIYSDDCRSFLKMHAETISFKEITPHQFALAASFSYLKSLGWNIEEFYGKPNGGKEGEIIGADIAIQRQYPMARHGEISTIMRFAEKYVWCSVHEIVGYLSDRLPYSINRDKPQIINDYSLIIDIPNPAQELYETEFDAIRNQTGWFLKSKLCPNIEEIDDINKHNIRLWIDIAPQPDLLEWLFANEKDVEHIYPFLKGEWCCLANFTVETEKKSYCDSALWINSFIIYKSDFDLLLYDLNLGNDNLIHNLINLDSNYASIESRFYASPYEACWANWKREYDNLLKFYTIKNGKLITYSFFNAVTKIIYKSLKYGEQIFLIPSKKVRDLSEIIEGTGFNFFDMHGDLKAFYHMTGTPCKNTQYGLFIKKDDLMMALDKNDMKIFWIVRLYREPSAKARDRLDYERYDRNIHFVCWEEDKSLRCLKLDDETVDYNPIHLEIPYLEITLDFSVERS